jgi:hypothetical protein
MGGVNHISTKALILATESSPASLYHEIQALDSFWVDIAEVYPSIPFN